MTAPRQINDPAPGFWLVRCCRHCPPVAARIWLCQTEPGTDNPVDQPYLQGQIGIELVPPADVWGRRGRPISENEYFFQITWLLWAERNEPDHPSFTYRQPVNIAAVPIPRWRTP